MACDPDDPRWLEAVRRGHPPGEFGHRDHLRLAWLILAETDADSTRAQAEVSRIVSNLAAVHGVPQRYNRTVTDAWVRIIAHCSTDARARGFDDLLRAHPYLTDKRALMRHYTSRTLASAAARQGWTEPDLQPIPAG